MATTKVRAYLDEERQIITQWAEGKVSPAEFQKLIDMTEECVGRLKDPEDVRILADGRQLNSSHPQVRKMALGLFRDKRIRKLAVWGAGPLARTTIRFVTVPLAMRNVRMFRTEAEAVEWLQQ